MCPHPKAGDPVHHLCMLSCDCNGQQTASRPCTQRLVFQASSQGLLWPKNSLKQKVFLRHLLMTFTIIYHSQETLVKAHHHPSPQSPETLPAEHDAVVMELYPSYTSYPSQIPITPPTPITPIYTTTPLTPMTPVTPSPITPVSPTFLCGFQI